MAKSTGIILAAGALPLTSAFLAAGNSDPSRNVRLIVGTLLATIAAAALDKIVAGLGTGTAVVLLVGALMKYGPTILSQLSAYTGGKK